MPIQLNWLPNANPKPGNRIDIGLELGGDDATIAGPSDGRIKLVEAAAVAGAKGAGAGEEKAERLIATFHGKFHRGGAGGDTLDL